MKPRAGRAVKVRAGLSTSATSIKQTGYVSPTRPERFSDCRAGSRVGTKYGLRRYYSRYHLADRGNLLSREGTAAEGFCQERASDSGVD